MWLLKLNKLVLISVWAKSSAINIEKIESFFAGELVIEPQKNFGLFIFNYLRGR